MFLLQDILKIILSLYMAVWTKSVFFEIINIKIIFLFKQKNPDLSFLTNTNKPLTPKANCKRRFKAIKKLPFIKLYNMVNLSKTIINN